jgi:hypothetical protein
MRKNIKVVEDRSWPDPRKIVIAFFLIKFFIDMVLKDVGFL